MLQLPDKEQSLWREAYKQSHYPTLQEDMEVDAVVVGAGITGLTAAYLLKQAGFKVAVLEKDTVGGGTTGRTTGKVTSQHNIIYHDLYERLGEATARVYGEANQAALNMVERIVRREKISCEWQRQDNYVYTADLEQIRLFKQEAKIARKLGLPASYETDTPLPFEVRAAVRFTDQGRMHAQKYVLGLAEAVHGQGSYVFEDSGAMGIRDGISCRITTRTASVFAKHCIVATNVPTFPLLARGGYCLLEYPTESYIVAGHLSRSLRGMYISPDDTHYSILPVTVEGERYLLIGGESNISGVRLNKESKYQRLAQYAEQHFGIEKITHRWSDRDYLAYDGIPLVGKLYPWSKNLYVASAFRKWGLTNGTAAAMILSDTILGNKNKWAAVFSATRLKPITSIPKVAVKYISRKS